MILYIYILRPKPSRFGWTPEVLSSKVKGHVRKEGPRWRKLPIWQSDAGSEHDSQVAHCHLFLEIDHQVLSPRYDVNPVYIDEETPVCNFRVQVLDGRLPLRESRFFFEIDIATHRYKIREASSSSPTHIASIGISGRKRAFATHILCNASIHTIQ